MSNESVIYDSEDLLCRFQADGPIEVSKSGPLYVFRVLSGSHIGIMKLEAEIRNPDTPWFFWPNHEGERGTLAEVHSRLESLENQTRGISVLYPVSAYCRTIIIGDDRGGIILSAMPDEKGRISQISVKGRTSERVEFTVKTGRSVWILTQYQGGREEALSWMTRILEKVKWPFPDIPENPGHFLLQLGLIGPDYDCMVPVDKGFMVMEEVAAVLRKHLGSGNWLHVFGYAHGHDILYPDYKPSLFLGGAEKLKEAIKGVHRKGQKVSFYLNLRLADQSLVENDFSLQKAVFLDSLGKRVQEKAHERNFFVMNPESREWQDRLIQEARHLVDLGADALELNFRGDNALMVPLGEQWGDGIRKIITRIREMGVKVWFRGGTDIYPSDWLEISQEELRIEEDGHIFSGCVLGEFDPRLFLTMVPGRSFLLPLSRDIPALKDSPVMRDLENIMGGLFIYDDEYMEQIEMILRRAAAEFSPPEEKSVPGSENLQGAESLEEEFAAARSVIDSLNKSEEN